MRRIPTAERNEFVRIVSKYDGRCACGNRIRKGKQIWWNPNKDLVRCFPCGPHIAAKDHRTTIEENDLPTRTEVAYLGYMISEAADYLADLKTKGLDDHLPEEFEFQMEAYLWMFSEIIGHDWKERFD